MMLKHWIFDCPAYRSLKPGPRAVLWELIRRYNGTNNGRIAYGARDMARAVQVADRQTIASYERELESKGFIRAVRRGGFSVKVSDRRVTEWALTWGEDRRRASDERVRALAGERNRRDGKTISEGR